MRTFIAISIPEFLRAAIGGIQERLKTHRLEIRWVRPDAIHLTLKFLGDIRPSDREAISSAMTASVKNLAPIRLAARRIGVFPNLRQPRVLWIGIADSSGVLADLYERLQEALGAIGFQKENRPFQGHLTLGRAKGRIDPNRLYAAIEEFQNFRSEPFVADRIALYRSELKPSGAVYTELVSIPLTQAARRIEENERG